MSVKKLFSHALLISFCLFAWLLLKRGIPWTGLVILVFYLYWRAKDHYTVFLFLALCLLCGWPRIEDQPDAMTQGTVVKASGRYAVLSHRLQRVIVYTDAPLQLDAVYQIKGDIQPIAYAGGFYRFQAENWIKQLGVCGQVSEKDITLIKTIPTPRYLLQKRICQKNEEMQPYLYKILLNMNVSEDNSLFFDNGFSYAGIPAALDLILKKFIDKQKRRKVVFAFTAALCIFYAFPLILLQSCLFYLLQRLDRPQSVKTGIGLIIIMILFPDSILSPSFLIPSVYRLSFLWQKERKRGCFLIIMMIQSCLFHAVNPVQSLLYPRLKNILGIVWLAALMSLFLPISFPLFSMLDGLWNMLDSLSIPGSMAGFGLIFFILMLVTLHHKKKFINFAIFWFFVFQCTGLFHPLAEIAFINVGQGDAILVRGAMNRENILIDTGKPSEWKNLQAYLDGEGIRHLNALLITHGDDDHNGSQQEVIDKYHPDQVITTHQKEVCTGRLCFYDLNEIESDDENESSLVSYFNLNGMNVLLTGDMTSYAEQRLVQNYPDLECDILKLSHHGSKTSSCDSFLDALKPAAAMISSGSYSLYHHPSPEVIQRLLKRHIPYFDTKEEGDIRILCIGPINLLLTSSGRIGVISCRRVS